jgi:hypothetical protein
MTFISSIFSYLSVKISTSSSNFFYPARPSYHRSKTMGCLILTELPIKPFALLVHGQGLVDEGLPRSLQDLPCLLWIIAGSHRLEKPINDRKKPLAGTLEVPARFSACSNRGRADLLTFGGSREEAPAAAAALPAFSAGCTEVPAIITSTDSTERALCPA